MTTVSEFNLPICTRQASGLQKIIADLLNSFSTAAFRNRNVLVNNISDNLPVHADPQVIASVLGGILALVTNHSKESLIAVSAKTYSDVVLIHVKDYNSLNGYTLDKHLQEVQPLAEKIGGFVNVTSRRQQITTITFSFQNF